MVPHVVHVRATLERGRHKVKTIVDGHPVVTVKPAVNEIRTFAFAGHGPVVLFVAVALPNVLLRRTRLILRVALVVDVVAVDFDHVLVEDLGLGEKGLFFIIIVVCVTMKVVRDAQLADVFLRLL